VKDGLSVCQILNLYGPPTGIIKIIFPERPDAWEFGVCPGCATIIEATRHCVFCPHCGSPLTLT
jgi:NADH pyrophosphatase NudC (nudix superfamily)